MWLEHLVTRDTSATFVQLRIRKGQRTLTKKGNLVSIAEIRAGLRSKYNKHAAEEYREHLSCNVVEFDRDTDAFVCAELFVNDCCHAIHIGMGMSGDDWGVGSLSWESIIGHESVHLALARLGLFVESSAFDACDYKFDKYMARWLYPDGSIHRRTRREHWADSAKHRKYLREIGVYEQYLHFYRSFGRYRNGGKMGRPL